MVDHGTKAGILTTFSKAMEVSGYGETARAEAIWAGIRGHRRTLERRLEMGESEVDAAWDSRGQRQMRKLQDKGRWFQKGWMKKKEGDKEGENGGRGENGGEDGGRGGGKVSGGVGAVVGGMKWRGSGEVESRKDRGPPTTTQDCGEGGGQTEGYSLQ